MEEVEKIPSIGISYTVELPGSKALVLQSFVGRDCDPKELNSVLDKIRVAAERQFAFGAIDQIKAKLEQDEKIAFDHAQRIEIVDASIKAEWEQSNRRGDPKLSAKQQTEQRQAYANAESIRKMCEKHREKIAEYEAMIGA